MHKAEVTFDVCVCVSPVLCVCSVGAEVGTLVLLSSRQITSCLTDFTSCCDATDADTCFATSPGERDRNDRECEKGEEERKERQKKTEDWEGMRDREEGKGEGAWEGS